MVISVKGGHKGGTGVSFLVAAALGRRFERNLKHGQVNQFSSKLRLERNVEADFEAYSANSWINANGLLLRPTSTNSYHLCLCDILRTQRLIFHR